jgi:hypothetical protein
MTLAIPSLIRDMPNEQYHSPEMKAQFVSKSGKGSLGRRPADRTRRG